MSMLNDIIWGIKDNEQECVANTSLVSVFAKRFPAGRWSFLRVAELMMIKFGESGHPVFRATSPLPEDPLKAKEVENYQYTSVPMVIRLKLFFAQSFLSISSVSTEQSQICVKSTAFVKQEQGDLLWQSILTDFSRQHTC